MSDLAKYNEVQELVNATKRKFNQIAQNMGGIEFEREKVFALNVLKDNSYLCGVAHNNKDSLMAAVLNVAAVGLTLNPVKKHAYLVPRDGKVCLDISYLGMIQVAVDIGAIEWAKAVLVYEEDQFKARGINEMPEHGFDPFLKDRGDLRGLYTVAKLPSGECLVDFMKIDDVHDIRDRSKAYQASVKKGSKCPWTTDYEQMVLKTGVRRAAKWWPMKENRDRFDAMMNVTTEDHVEKELIDVEETGERSLMLERVREIIEFLGKTEEQTFKFLTQVCKREIEALEDMTNVELQEFEVALNEWKEKASQNEDSKESDSAHMSAEQVSFLQHQLDEDIRAISASSLDDFPAHEHMAEIDSIKQVLAHSGPIKWEDVLNVAANVGHKESFIKQMREGVIKCQ